MITKFDGSFTQREVAFTVASFWIHIWNLHLVCRNEIYTKSIGGHLGEVVQVDFGKNDFCWNSYMRICVMLDVSKPLESAFVGHGSNIRNS